MSVKINVKIIPDSKKTLILEFVYKNDSYHLKISIKEPAKLGKANIGLINFLQKITSLDHSDIKITSGHKNPKKIILLKNLPTSSLKKLFDDYMNKY